MPKHQVEITETLSKIVDIEASDERTAVDKVSHEYIIGHIVLDAENYVETNISIYKENTTFADEVRRCIKTLRDFDATVLYTALLLSDVEGKKNPTDEECNVVVEATKAYESLYNEQVREEVKILLKK